MTSSNSWYYLILLAISYLRYPWRVEPGIYIIILAISYLIGNILSKISMEGRAGYLYHHIFPESFLQPTELCVPYQQKKKSFAI